MAKASKAVDSNVTVSEAKKWLDNRTIAQDTRYVVFFDCFKSNPRGNFNDGNRPSVFETDRGSIGEVWPTTLKRCLRETMINRYHGVTGMDVFIQSGVPLAPLVDGMPGDDLALEMCQKWGDVRMFGGVVLGSKENGEIEVDIEEEGKKGKKGKAKSRQEAIVGPVVVESAETLDPVRIEDITITRCAPQKLEANVDQQKSHNVGSVSHIRYARYRFGVYVESYMAKKTGFSVEDLDVLEQSLMDLYRFRRSAGRPSIRTRAVYKIVSKIANIDTIAMDAAMDAIQCKKVGDPDAQIVPDSYELPAVFENDSVVVTRIK